jgi:hypothetical protein
MSRINRYQEGILKFIKTKSFINKTSSRTKDILYELLELSNHIPAILCLTILNNLCKKTDVKIHGYYLATGIDIMTLMAKVCNNREYFEDKYGINSIDNMIVEVNSWFYACITSNIETLRLGKNGQLNHNVLHLCIEYATKYLYQITQKNTYLSRKKMKKTDIMCMNLFNNHINSYKQKNKLEKEILLTEIYTRYGSVCKLALCLSWIIGQGDIKKLEQLEGLGNHIGMFLKIYDDFRYLERDLLKGEKSLNYIVNYGIKEAYMELIESKTSFIEGSLLLGINTKTSKEIIDTIVRDIDIIVQDVSVDLETQYDDMSSI